MNRDIVSITARRLFGVMLHAALGVVVCNALQAQPAGKAIRLIVPFGPGGGQDILARAFNNELGAALGDPVIIDYKPGAGGAVGSGFVAKSEPDGRTLLMAAAGHTISALITPKPPYDPVNDFAAVAHIATGSQVMLLGSHVPAKTLGEFIAHARANPGKLNYGSAGIGSSTHLGVVYVAKTAGIEMTHIPYKSNAEPINELLGGRIDLVGVPIISGLQYLNDPRVRLIGITGRTRSTFMPNVPPIAESFPGFGYESWFGLLGPAGTPGAVIERVNAAMTRILQTPAMIDRLAKLGLEPESMRPDAFTKVLQADRDRVAEIIKAAGIVR